MGGVSIRIRPIAVDDAEAYMDLLAWLDNESHYPVVNLIERSMDAADWRTAIADLLSRRERIILVAESVHDRTGISRGLVGFLSTTPDWFGEDHGQRIVIGIREAYTGQGIGTRLFAAVEDWARESGSQRLHLTVETDNARALALYHKMGFSIEGHIRNALQIKGHWYDDYVMAKSLAPQSPASGQDRLGDTGSAA
jgi:RimJ/RimL family protein N-acetyltransferase